MSTQSELAEKESYSELTPLQQEIVDLRAQNPDLSQRELAEEHGDTTQQSVSRVERSYSDIIRKRREELGVEEEDEQDELDEFFDDIEVPGEESNANGQEKTESGPVTIMGGPIDATDQRFDERPFKNQLTDEQDDFIENLNVSDLEKQVIRLKTRNPDLTGPEIAETLGQNQNTVSTYLSKNRDAIQRVSALPYQEEEDDVEESMEISVAFPLDEVVGYLTTGEEEKVKQRFVSELIRL